jgi:hypothetical protein
MANYGQHKQDSSASGGGEGLAIVELCALTGDGVTFWSQRRFQIGTELMLRLTQDSLPPGLTPLDALEDPWAIVRGFVVECTRERRADGSQAFKVVLLMERALDVPAAPVLPCIKIDLPGIRAPGLN